MLLNSSSPCQALRGQPLDDLLPYGTSAGSPHLAADVHLGLVDMTYYSTHYALELG